MNFDAAPSAPHRPTSGDIDWPRTPPAAESYAKLATMPPFPKKRVGWGLRELVLLVETLWPDIAPSGVPFDEVLKRAERARLALEEKTEPSILSKVLRLTRIQRLHKFITP